MEVAVALGWLPVRAAKPGGGPTELVEALAFAVAWAEGSWLAVGRSFLGCLSFGVSASGYLFLLEGSICRLGVVGSKLGACLRDLED